VHTQRLNDEYPATCVIENRCSSSARGCSLLLSRPRGAEPRPVSPAPCGAGCGSAAQRAAPPGTRGRISFNLSAVITAVRSRPRGPARCAVRATRLRDARLTVSVGPRYVIFLFRVETAVRHRPTLPRGREPENHREPGPGTRAQAPRRPRDRTRRDRNDWLHRSSYTPPELDKPRTYSQFPYQPYRDAPPARLAAITRGLRARRARSPK
jgi:hypothetical protein